MPISASVRTALDVFSALALPGTVRLGLVNEPVRRLSTGIPVLDAALDGGLPRGRLSELTGPVTSGKTALLFTALAAATQRGEFTALIDLPNALHPAQAERAGIALPRVLWVRPPSAPDGLRCAELILEARGFGLVAVDLGVPAARGLRASVWPRLARAAERAGAAVVLVADRRLAGSFAALSLAVAARSRHWHRGAWPLFDGLTLQLRVARNKLNAPGRHLVLQAITSSQEASTLPLLRCRNWQQRREPSPDGRLSAFNV